MSRDKNIQNEQYIANQLFNNYVDGINRARQNLLKAFSLMRLQTPRWKENIDALDKATEPLIKAYKDEWNKDSVKSNPKDLFQRMSEIEAFYNQTTFLATSITLCSDAKAVDSKLSNSVFRDIGRIGYAILDRTVDTFVDEKGRLRSPITMVEKMTSNFILSLSTVVTGFIGANVGMAKGIRQGFVENEGALNKLGGMIAGGFTGSIKGGYKGIADSVELLPAHLKARKTIQELRTDNGRELDILEKKQSKDPAVKARIAVLKEEGKLLTELETRLNKSTDPKEDRAILRSLRLLTMASAGASIMQTGYEIIHDFKGKQKFGGLDGGKALEKLSMDMLHATQSYNAVLDNPEFTTLGKVGITLLAMVNSNLQGLGGFISGGIEGFQQKNWGSTIKGAIYGAQAGAITGAKQTVEQWANMRSTVQKHRETYRTNSPPTEDNDQDINLGKDGECTL